LSDLVRRLKAYALRVGIRAEDISVANIGKMSKQIRLRVVSGHYTRLWGETCLTCLSVVRCNPKSLCGSPKDLRIQRAKCRLRGRSLLETL
jgi:hypothetical protein